MGDVLPRRAAHLIMISEWTSELQMEERGTGTGDLNSLRRFTRWLKCRGKATSSLRHGVFISVSPCECLFAGRVKAAKKFKEQREVRRRTLHALILQLTVCKQARSTGNSGKREGGCRQGAAQQWEGCYISRLKAAVGQVNGCT